MTDEMKAYIAQYIDGVLAPMMREQSDKLMAQLEANAADVVKQWERYPTPEERRAEAEQRAWDMYFALARDRLGRQEAVEEASKMLELRRKRFGSGKEEDVQPKTDAAPPPAPVGNCPRCGIRHYATVGTCGACGWPNPR